MIRDDSFSMYLHVISLLLLLPLAAISWALQPNNEILWCHGISSISLLLTLSGYTKLCKPRRSLDLYNYALGYMVPHNHFRSISIFTLFWFTSLRSLVLGDNSAFSISIQNGNHSRCTAIMVHHWISSSSQIASNFTTRLLLPALNTSFFLFLF